MKTYYSIWLDSLDFPYNDGFDVFSEDEAYRKLYNFDPGAHRIMLMGVSEI